MFKLTGKSGFRAGGSGGGAGSRVNAAVMHNITPGPHRRRVAFLPDTPEEQIRSSSSNPRVTGLKGN